MPQGLTVTKSEPLQPAGAPPPDPSAAPALSVVKSEPLALAGGRGAGPGAPASAAGGRGGGPGDVKKAAATPPPSQPFYPGGWKAAAQDFGGMVGGGVAAAAAGAMLPAVAPVAGVTALTRMLPTTARVLRGAAGIAGAGAGGAGAAAVTGSPATAPEGSEDSVWDAFKRQAEMEAAGLGIGWAASALGRRLIASRVAGKAKEWLDATRSFHMDDVRGIFQRAQDAIRQHASRGAEQKLARTQVTSALGDEAALASAEARGAGAAAKAAQASGDARVEQLKARWPSSEAQVAPPMPPVAAPGQKARYAFTQSGMGEGPDVPLYEVLDTSHPLAGSHVSAETLTKHGFPIPAHTPPPAMNPTARAAVAVKDVVEGPSQRSLDILGQAVEAAAETGPPLKWGPIQEKLRAMHAKIQPVALSESADLTANPNVAYFKDAEQARTLLAKAGVELEAGHPLPGVLGKIEEIASDTLPFRDVHRFKRMLDDAIGWKPAGAVHAPARGQLKQITKGIRGEIRKLMEVHTPYAQATQTYREASTLFGPQGLARKIQAAAAANPEALANSLVKVSEPTKFKMLKEVLTDHARKGGGEAGAQEGQQAWQAVQSTVMYKHLIQPGIDNFEASVAKMHPEFLDTLTGDPYARQVFDRLRTMSEAVKKAQADTALTVTGHQQARQSALDRSWRAQGQKAVITRTGAQQDARHAVEGAELQTARQEAGREVQEAAKPTAAERAFAKSSLSKPTSAVVEGSDVAYAAIAPPGSPRQVAGVARLVLRGPKVNDLIQWASLSPSGTQMFVRAVTGPKPGQALAAMIRLYDWATGEEAPKMMPAHEPTNQKKAATPPPGPR